jgi:hypothetical protein
MHPKILVQSLKGSKGQILWAFYFAMKAMDVDELIGWTSLKRETCYHALDALEAVNLLGTQTVAHGRKVWLLGSEMLPLLRDLARQLGSGAELLNSGQESVKRTPGALNVVVDDLSLELPTIATITTTSGQESVKRTPGEQASLNGALDEFKIIGKKRAELIEREWVTAAYVRAHVAYAQNEGSWDQPIGMAITRMLENVPIPATRDNGHPENCQCAKCKADDFFGQSKRRKYVEGPYSDYIEH